MNGHLSAERMHDLVDGLLASVEAEEARAHLEGCVACRAEHARLAEVVAALRAVPREARVPEGLWAGIQGRIQGRPAEGVDAEAEVLAFPGARRGPRRFVFTVPQLAAAAVVVSVLSAGAMWMAVSGGGGTLTPGASAALTLPVGPAARAASSGEGYDQAVFELERIVDQGKPYLAPETVAALDRSLQTIDDALAEIRRALAADPNNELLARMLVRQQTSKLRVLSQAATVVQGRS